MPRKTKEQKELENKKITSTKQNKEAKSNSKISANKKNLEPKNKKSTSKNTASAKSTTKKVVKTTKRTTSTSKSSQTKAKKATSPKRSTTKSPKIAVVEYYDLPYRYNQTIVKVLAQTPNTLFVYWDIADSDRENFKKQYGYDFFDKTYPILIVHNRTMNYSFEVDINDFANSWYLHVNDANCDYEIELGRKPIYNYVSHQVGKLEQKDKNSEFNKYPSKPIDKDYFYVTMSNPIDAPNDHILLEDSNKPIGNILIRNVKSNNEYRKNINDLPISKHLNKIYNIQNIYKALFEEKIIKEFYNDKITENSIYRTDFCGRSLFLDDTFIEEVIFEPDKNINFDDLKANDGYDLEYQLYIANHCDVRVHISAIDGRIFIEERDKDNNMIEYSLFELSQKNKQ